MGDFEYALLFYHRGYQARSDFAEFRIGIQKSQEAIENAIGSKLNNSKLKYTKNLHGIAETRKLGNHGKIMQPKFCMASMEPYMALWCVCQERSTPKVQRKDWDYLK